MFNWLHTYSPQPIFLDLGIIKVYWYGLLISLATAVCLIILFRLNKSKKEIQSHLGNLFFYLIIFGLLGGRLWHILFYNLPYFLENPLAIFKIWQGGLAISGAIFGGALTVYFYCRRHQLPFWQYADLLAMVLPLGQAIGRLGNYFNQELFGLPCNFSWCIPIAAANRLPAYFSNQYFHPVFLYEAILCFLLFVFCLFLFKYKKTAPGSITLIYLLGYSLIRFFMEFLRLDITTTWPFGLKWTQWLALGIMIISIWYFSRLSRKSC